MFFIIAIVFSTERFFLWSSNHVSNGGLDLPSRSSDLLRESYVNLTSDFLRESGIQPDGIVHSWEAMLEVGPCDDARGDFNTEPLIHVATALDPKYLVEVFPSWLTALASSNLSNLIILHILTNELSAVQRYIVRLLVKKIMRGSVSFTLAVDITRFNETYTYGGLPHISVVTQARLLLPGLLPCREKIIWIDMDAFVVGDLYPAWTATQLPDCGIAGREMNTYFFDSWRATKHFRWNEVFGKAFNAGVVVLDLSRLRDNHFERLVERFAVKLGLDDQFTLNMACNGTYTRLEAGMNVFQREYYGFTPPHDEWIVVHFLGDRKPWLGSKAETPELQEIWEVNRVAFGEALIDSNIQKT